ncbi:hypothetical protein [Sutterella sp.]|uniref:hypothetical protein n=1 Tax=Sutterella sp. TaxID=1981025 RepID=UPI0026E0EB88|nr:hypothetical protein [Sutterella sp.]MDO5531407.1 hypothetical protein [Sutterella sp.]
MSIGPVACYAAIYFTLLMLIFAGFFMLTDNAGRLKENPEEILLPLAVITGPMAVLFMLGEHLRGICP